MKRALFPILFLVTSLCATAWADGDHSADVCSTVDAKVCGHIGHMEGFDSSSEGSFVAHLSIPGKTPVTNMNVELWMPDMGHGSSPVKLTLMSLNKYKVTEVFFVMPGEWEVRMSFNVAGVAHRLVIPVHIQK